MRRGAKLRIEQSITFSKDRHKKGVPIQVDEPETVHGHLAVFPKGNGARLILDARIFALGRPQDAPLFHFDTEDVAAAHHHAVALGVEIVTPVQFEQWFTIRDPDGNVLMICRC